MTTAWVIDKVKDEAQRIWYAKKVIEGELVKNITKLLLELGTGFAFIGISEIKGDFR